MRNTYKFLVAFALILTANVSSTMAAENGALLDKSKLSIGAGISNNSISGRRSDETGFQFFAAYDLNQVNLMDGVSSSVELGYMDYGFSRQSGGIWGTYVAEGNIADQLGWLARLGLDVGDDSGLMLGAGLSFAVNSRMDLRGEYVVRDDIDSLQFNLIYHL
jgi:opacity protein-like surface antigen